VLWPKAEWEKPVEGSLGENVAVKEGYYKAIRVVHPDRLMADKARATALNPPPRLPYMDV